VALEESRHVYESNHCYLLLEATRRGGAAEMGWNIVDSLESTTSAPANDDGNNIWVEQYWREKSLPS
jgi:hypothetical protein